MTGGQGTRTTSRTKEICANTGGEQVDWDERADEQAARDERIEWLVARLLRFQARLEKRGKRELPEHLEAGRYWPELKDLVKKSGEKWEAFLKRRGLKQWDITQDIRMAKKEPELIAWARKRHRKWPDDFSLSEARAIVRQIVGGTGSRKRNKNKGGPSGGGAVPTIDWMSLADDARYQQMRQGFESLTHERKRLHRKDIEAWAEEVGEVVTVHPVGQEPERPQDAQEQPPPPNQLPAPHGKRWFVIATVEAEIPAVQGMRASEFEVTPRELRALLDDLTVKVTEYHVMEVRAGQDGCAGSACARTER
jgi:hypothetical protein